MQQIRIGPKPFRLTAHINASCVDQHFMGYQHGIGLFDIDSKVIAKTQNDKSTPPV